MAQTYDHSKDALQYLVQSGAVAGKKVETDSKTLTEIVRAAQELSRAGTVSFEQAVNAMTQIVAMVPAMVPLKPKAATEAEHRAAYYAAKEQFYKVARGTSARVLEAQKPKRKDEEREEDHLRGIELLAANWTS